MLRHWGFLFSALHPFSDDLLEECAESAWSDLHRKQIRRKKTCKKDIQDDHSESDTEIEENENKTVSDPVTDTNEVTKTTDSDTGENTETPKTKKKIKKTVSGDLDLRKIKRQFRRNVNLWKSEREMQKKRHANIRTELTPQEYGRYLVREWFGGEWKTSILTPILGVGIVILCVNVIHGAVGHVKTAPETEIETESETAYVYPEKDITIGSTGCMLLHSPFIDSYPDAEGNYDFSTIYKYITPYYSAPDFMTCEFEGALAGPEAGYSGYPLFLSPDIIIENIKDSGVDLQFLATNHIYDGGSDGFHRTMQVYDEKNIAFSGVREKNSDKQRTIRMRWRRKLCDLGVNAIIGGHPHCEQPIHVLDTSDGSGHMFCIYSEGNALSNQRTYLMDEMPTGHTEDGAMVTLTLHQNSDGSVEIKDIDLLPTWVYRYQDNDGSKYYILPLDDVANIEKTTGISDIQQEAQDSYDRTIEELGPGLEKAKQVFGGSSISTTTTGNTSGNTGSSLMNLGVE